MNLIIYGDSNYAELIKYYFESDSEYRVVAFCVDREYKTKEQFCGLPVVALEELEEFYPTQTHHLFVAIGYRSMRVRRALFLKAKAKGYPLASYISSQAILDDSNRIGDNCMLLPGVILEPFASIEENCFLNTGVTVCHHSKIRAHSFLAARSLVGGYSEVGENSFLGFQATVIQQLVLAPETLVAANSTLLQNSEESTMYAGSPAKVIKKHSELGIRIV